MGDFPDRPTREQVEDVMQRAAIANLPWTLALAAEVCALRADLAVAEKLATEWVESGKPQRLELRGPGRRALSQLARTPQPAEPVIYRCDQSNHPSVPCSRCEVVTHAPLPAVPGGEDATACMNCGLPLGPPETWGQAQVGPVHNGCPDDADDGEDVPARLDAAAEALHAHKFLGLAADFYDAAMVLRERGTPDVRAAVAAALARPTERER